MLGAFCRARNRFPGIPGPVRFAKTVNGSVRN